MLLANQRGVLPVFLKLGLVGSISTSTVTPPAPTLDVTGSIPTSCTQNGTDSGIAAQSKTAAKAGSSKGTLACYSVFLMRLFVNTNHEFPWDFPGNVISGIPTPSSEGNCGHDFNKILASAQIITQLQVCADPGVAMG